MSFKNSALESYGVVTDSQLPESMEAFAAILSKSAYAAQNSSPVPDSEEQEPDPEAGNIFQVIRDHPHLRQELILREVLP